MRNTSRRHPTPDFLGGNVCIDHCASGNDGSISDPHSRQHDYIGTNPNVISDDDSPAGGFPRLTDHRLTEPDAVIGRHNGHELRKHAVGAYNNVATGSSKITILVDG